MQQSIAVERSIWIAAPRERAWQAVTDPAQLSQWYAAFYHWEIPALHVGAMVKFYNKDDHADLQIATIEVVDPPREFRLRWHGQPELVTTFVLAEENGGTRATISEVGYGAVLEDQCQEWTDATGGGYTMSMQNLKAFVEGRDLPY